MLPKLPAPWRQLLQSETKQPYFRDLQDFLTKEYASQTVSVYPPADKVFAALEFTPYDDVKVLLLGQDPYHGANQANGLAFSVNRKTPLPPSLKNIFTELHNDLGFDIPNHGSLERWAEQGVLLLNAVLTVRQASPNSHKGRGWETFTDAIIRKVNEKETPVVFVLWGKYAQKKISLIDTTRHKIVECAHPSPLSAHRFFGCRPFSQVNTALLDAGITGIDWQIPNA